LEELDRYAVNADLLASREKPSSVDAKKGQLTDLELRDGRRGRFEDRGPVDLLVPAGYRQGSSRCSLPTRPGSATCSMTASLLALIR
jgi:hypothetical protein